MPVATIMGATQTEAIAKILDGHHTTTVDVSAKCIGVHIDDLTGHTDEQNDAELKFHFYTIFCF